MKIQLKGLLLFFMVLTCHVAALSRSIEETEIVQENDEELSTLTVIQKAK